MLKSALVDIIFKSPAGAPIRVDLGSATSTNVKSTKNLESFQNWIKNGYRNISKIFEILEYSIFFWPVRPSSTSLEVKLVWVGQIKTLEIPCQTSKLIKLTTGSIQTRLDSIIDYKNQSEMTWE